MARTHSGCEVLEQSPLEPKLPSRRFNGVFANAVLIHVPRKELLRVLRQIVRVGFPHARLHRTMIAAMRQCPRPLRQADMPGCAASAPCCHRCNPEGPCCA